MKWNEGRQKGATMWSDDVEGKVEVLAGRGKLEIPFWQGRIRGRLAVGLARVGMMPVSLLEFHNIFKKSIANHLFFFFFLSPFHIDVPGSKEILQLL